MNKMKKLTVVFICVLFGCTAAAQPRANNDRPKPPSPTEMLERITKDLQLSETQQTQLKTFLDSQDLKARPTDEERKIRGENDRKLMDIKLKTILTTAQYTKWQQIKAKRRPKGDKPPRESKNN